MFRTFSVILCSLVLLASGCRVPRTGKAAPFSVRNQHPVELTVLQQVARSPIAYTEGPSILAIDTDWTSHWVQPRAGADDLRLDGETARAELRAGWGLGKSWDIEVELPLMYASGGTLDGFIDAFHQFFGLPQNGRNRHPRDDFDIQAIRNQPGLGMQTVYELQDDELGVGDIPIHLGWFPIQDSSGFSMGFRASAELPTGDQSKGFGNGEMDWALGVSTQWDGSWLSLFGWGSYTWSGTPDRAKQAGFSYANRSLMGLGTEIFLFDGVSGLVQVEYQDSVLRHLDDPNAHGNQLPIYFGFRWRMGEGKAIDLGLGEDLLPNVSPDVVFHLALRFDL